MCCVSDDTHSQKGTYNTSFVPAALASFTFQIIVQYLVSYIKSIEWNSTSDNAAIQVLFTFDSTKKPHSNVRR